MQDDGRKVVTENSFAKVARLTKGQKEPFGTENGRLFTTCHEPRMKVRTFPALFVVQIINRNLRFLNPWLIHVHLKHFTHFLVPHSSLQKDLKSS